MEPESVFMEDGRCQASSSLKVPHMVLVAIVPNLQISTKLILDVWLIKSVSAKPSTWPLGDFFPPPQYFIYQCANVSRDYC